MRKNEFWLRLLQVKNKPGKKITNYLPETKGDLVEQLSAYFDLLALTDLQRQQFWQVDAASLSRTLNWLEKEGNQLITWHDSAYPELLRHINSPPIAIFVQGNSAILNYPQLAMVGSRNFTEYGQQWADYFSSELAGSGMVITSGLAIGIDSLCHKGALRAEGYTIAVLGSGLSNITPKSNLALARQIIEQQGCLVSEFFPADGAFASHFPRRNRIISGMSQGVLVVEAGLKSGSLITARYALEQGREVFALPGPLGYDGYAGTHWLIKQGAYLVSEPSDILEELNSSLEWLMLDKLGPQSDHKSGNIIQVLNGIPTPVDIIAYRVNLPITDVMIKLLELELDGSVTAVSGGYIRNHQRG